MSEPIRYGIIGCGSMGREHIENIKSLDGTEAYTRAGSLELSADGTLTSVTVHILGTNDAAVIAEEAGADHAVVTAARAQFSRDLRLGGNRVMSLTLNANNLLNTVNFGGINTTVNSPSFGQVTSVRAMRSMKFNARFRF